MNDKLSDKYIDLYDHYVHSLEPRREFLKKLAKAAGGTAAAAVLLPWLEGTGAEAAMVAPGDGRLTTGMESFAGTGQGMKAYVVRPKGSAKLPAVVVVHENRGLTPHIRDVARRMALEGFLAVAPDMMAPIGGTPNDRDKARDQLYDIPSADVMKNLVGTAAFARTHEYSTGKVGCVGFCWGGGQTLKLAVNDPSLLAAVSYYGSRPKKGIEKINAVILLHVPEKDKKRMKQLGPLTKDLKKHGKSYESHVYPGARHAFNNDARPARYDEAAAKLAWKRTVALFKKNLGG